MAYNQVSIRAAMFDELVTHAGNSRHLIELAEYLNIPANLYWMVIFFFLLLFFNLGVQVGALGLLLLHKTSPLFVNLISNIFHCHLGCFLQDDL
jgi:hypothetical protein